MSPGQGLGHTCSQVVSEFFKIPEDLHICQKKSKEELTCNINQILKRIQLFADPLSPLIHRDDSLMKKTLSCVENRGCNAIVGVLSEVISSRPFRERQSVDMDSSQLLEQRLMKVPKFLLLALCLMK